MSSDNINTIIVDDESYDLDMIHKSVAWKELGFEIVTTICNPQKALSFLQENGNIDLLISDIQMPIISGLELYEYALVDNPRLKAIFISGHEEFKYAKKALDLSASSYILKPVNNQELTAVLRKVKHSIHEQFELFQNEQVLEKNETTAQEDNAFRSSILMFIDKHEEEVLTLNQIAQHFHYTPNYISSQFKLMTGKSLGYYLIERRIEKAARMLMQPDITVLEICDKLGYSSPAYFVQLFKKFKGSTPGQYKQEMKHKFR